MDYEKKDFRKLYEDLVKSDWFKRAYHNKSLGECPFDISDLAESEDEKIRKEMIRYFTEMKKGGSASLPYDDCIAYLERQKEEEGYEAIPVESTLEYKLGFNAGKETRWSPTKEQVNALETTVRLSNFGCDKERRKILLSLLEQLKQSEEKQKEQKLTDTEWAELQSEFKNINEAFEDGKKEVIDNPEKYGLQKENKFAPRVLPCSAAWFEDDDEKQKEHKPVEKQDYSGLNDLEKAIHRGFLAAGVDNVPVEIIKETAKECLTQMKPAEWSEDWREEDIQTRFAFYTYKDDSSELYLSNVFVEEASRNHGFGTKILRAAEKVAETIGATTISLKVKQDSPANAWYRKRGYGYVAFEDGYDWLEKNLEYMKPNKQEWSEEDEKILNELLDHCNTENATWYNWLKSLRPQPKQNDMITPNKEFFQWIYDRLVNVHNEDPNVDYMISFKKRIEELSFDEPSWKPSEEQIKAVKHAYNCFPNKCSTKSNLKRLYFDLKKLM